MDTQKKRRIVLLERLKEASKPVTGTELARELGVSRQVIVGDIAILRAGGIAIYATPQGYVFPVVAQEAKHTVTLACQHGRDKLAEELAIIIDNGGKVLDVVVEHPLYGEMKANLMLSSRRDLTAFLDSLVTSGAEPLSLLTGGVHLHTIEVPSEQVLLRIKKELQACEILFK